MTYNDKREKWEKRKEKGRERMLGWKWRGRREEEGWGQIQVLYHKLDWFDVTTAFTAVLLACGQ